MDEVRDQGYISVPKSEEIESGQMAVKKVKWKYFGINLSQTREIIKELKHYNKHQPPPLKV